MDTYLQSLLMVGSLSSLRQDDAVSRQAVMNFNTSSHLMDLTFIRDATEMSIPESYAVQGLSLSHFGRESQATNLAAQTPKS